ncbi:MAG: AtpZ/AtpI family protein [Actinomycetota bacterium]
MARRPEGGDAWGGYGTAWTVISELLAGIGVWGAIGFGLDALFDTEKVFLPIGLVLGAAGGIYLVYLRHGREKRDS